MNPQELFCLNLECPARGQKGKGNRHYHTLIAVPLYGGLLSESGRFNHQIWGLKQIVIMSNIIVHSQKEQRCLCTVCNWSFVVTKGTIFYRLHTDPKTVVCVLTLLAYGCPLQAIVHAFELDERTVRNWHERAGKHCQAMHETMVSQKPMDLQQVQSDEIKVKVTLLQKGHF